MIDELEDLRPEVREAYSTLDAEVSPPGRVSYEAYRAWFAFLHNCVAHPLLFLTANASWTVRFHDWTAAKWLGEP